MNINIETAVVILGEICKDFDKGCLSEGVIQEAKEFIQLHAKMQSPLKYGEVSEISRRYGCSRQVASRAVNHRKGKKELLDFIDQYRASI